MGRDKSSEFLHCTPEHKGVKPCYGWAVIANVYCHIPCSFEFPPALPCLVAVGATMVTNAQATTKGAIMVFSNCVFISVISFQVLLFCWLFRTALTAIQFRPEPGIIFTRRFRAAASLWLIRAPVRSGDRVKRVVPAKVQPLGLIQPCRKCVETSDDVIEEAFTNMATMCLAFILSGIA